MKRYEWIPGKLLYILPLLVLALIGNPVAFAQDIEAGVHPIQNVIATSNVTSEEGVGPENTVNGSGLNDNGEHSTRADDMWLAAPGNEPLYIQFEFDGVYELKEMWVWNYNVMFELLLGFGVKDVTIAYSENGADWTILDDMELPQATATADYVANTIIPLGGISAQYVRLKIRSGWGVLGQFGLSEVWFLPLSEPGPSLDAYPISNVVATSNAISGEGEGPENTVNGSGLNANFEHSSRSTDMWLAEMNDEPVYIQYEFDDVYELDEMWVWNYNTRFEAMLGFGVKEAAIAYSENGADWAVLGDVSLAQGPATPDYAVGTIIDFDGVSAQYVRLTVLSGWSVFGQVGLSEVRFFSNQAPSSPMGSYTLVLDTFETYTDASDGNERIYQVWFDGWMNETNSTVGYLQVPFAEREIVNSGLQAMPLFYDNTRPPFYSEGYRVLEAELKDWRAGDADALTLYFHGSTDQDHNIETDGLYVAIEDDLGGFAVVHHGAPEDLLSDDWQEWTIDFEQFAGVDLRHVTRLILGVGDRDNPQPGGSSVVYIDDIGLSAGVGQ